MHKGTKFQRKQSEIDHELFLKKIHRLELSLHCIARKTKNIIRQVCTSVVILSKCRLQNCFRKFFFSYSKNLTTALNTPNLNNTFSISSVHLMNIYQNFFFLTENIQKMSCRIIEKLKYRKTQIIVSESVSELLWNIIQETGRSAPITVVIDVSYLILNARRKQGHNAFQIQKQFLLVIRMSASSQDNSFLFHFFSFIFLSYIIQLYCLQTFR